MPSSRTANPLARAWTGGRRLRPTNAATETASQGATRRAEPATSWAGYLSRVSVLGVGVLGVREGPSLHVGGEAPGGPVDLLPKTGVPLHELRVPAEAQAEHVRHHQDLAVAVRTGPDADGGHPDRLGDLPGHLGRDPLEHQGEDARLLQGQGVLEETLGGLLRLGLHP